MRAKQAVRLLGNGLNPLDPLPRCGNDGIRRRTGVGLGSLHTRRFFTETMDCMGRLAHPEPEQQEIENRRDRQPPCKFANWEFPSSMQTPEVRIQDPRVPEGSTLRATRCVTLYHSHSTFTLAKMTRTNVRLDLNETYPSMSASAYATIAEYP